MIQTLLALAAFVAFASAQCAVEGGTYVSGAVSVTFGVQVGAVWPSLLNSGANGLVWFTTWRAATTTRWEVLNVGLSQPLATYCTDKGQYDVSFSSDCSSITFLAISDTCTDRKALLDGATITTEAPPTSKDCTTVGTQLTMQLQPSTASPRLSQEVANVIFGDDQFAIVSVGTQAALFQRWQLSTSSNQDRASIVDLGSTPAGLSCSTTIVADYLTGWSTDGACSVRLCGVIDSCLSRAQLFHDSPINGFSGDQCAAPVESPITAVGLCNPSGGQWLRHPWDCTGQNVPSGCMFCKGIAQGQTVSLCLERQSAKCNDIFESPAASAWCNLEFECPASYSATGLMFVVLVAIVSLVLSL